MNKYNHSLTSFNVLFLFYMNTVSIFEIVLFSYIFGVFIDKTQKLNPHFDKKPTYHKRIWMEEPLGLLLVGVPTGWMLSFVKPEYFLMTIIPYGIHILLDYLVIHEVCPLAPFSKKTVWLKGMYKAHPPKKWHRWTKGKPSENYLVVVNIAVLAILLFIYFSGNTL